MWMGQLVYDVLKSCLLLFFPDKFRLLWFGFLNLSGILVGRMVNDKVIEWPHYGGIPFYKSPIVSYES